MLSKIEHFVVLMLENRSFDHLLGPLKAQNPAIVGARDNEFTNPTDPAAPASPTVSVGPVSAFAMPFDPGQLVVVLDRARRKPLVPSKTRRDTRWC
jgi:phospholipase C